MTMHLVKLCVGAKTVDDLASAHFRKSVERFSDQKCAQKIIGAFPAREGALTKSLTAFAVGNDKPETTLSRKRPGVEKRSLDNEKAGPGRIHEHVTRMHPRREAALLDGGSIFWVIKGVILVRQHLLAFETRTGADGIRRCAILIDPALVLTEPQSRRAFQGWRYLRPEDAPLDAKKGARGNPPPELVVELAELGLL